MSKYIILNNVDEDNINSINATNTDRKLSIITLLDGRDVLSLDMLYDDYWSEYHFIYTGKEPVDIDPMLIFEYKLQWLVNRDGKILLPENYVDTVNFYTQRGEL